MLFSSKNSHLQYLRKALKENQGWELNLRFKNRKEVVVFYLYNLTVLQTLKIINENLKLILKLRDVLRPPFPFDNTFAGPPYDHYLIHAVLWIKEIQQASTCFISQMTLLCLLCFIIRILLLPSCLSELLLVFTRWYSFSFPGTIISTSQIHHIWNNLRLYLKHLFCS